MVGLTEVLGGGVDAVRAVVDDSKVQVKVQDDDIKMYMEKNKK